MSKLGGLAQLARAPALHAGGHRFDSDILHKRWMLHRFSRRLSGPIFSTRTDESQKEKATKVEKKSATADLKTKK
jgi:hypothetical protein